MALQGFWGFSLGSIIFELQAGWKNRFFPFSEKYLKKYTDILFLCLYMYVIDVYSLSFNIFVD